VEWRLLNASDLRPTNLHGLLQLQWLCWSRCKHVDSSLHSFSSHVYLLCTIMHWVQFWCVDHFLSGIRGCYVLWHARSIHISDEYVQETTPRNLALHLAVYLNVIIRMKCVGCIVSFLSREMSFHGIIFSHQMHTRNLHHTASTYLNNRLIIHNFLVHSQCS
jgi:hypothetical protein